MTYFYLILCCILLQYGLAIGYAINQQWLLFALWLAAGTMWIRNLRMAWDDR